MEDKQVYTDLGRLNNQIENIHFIVQEMRNENKEDRELFKEKLQLLNNLDREFKEAKPVLKDINKWKERTIGAVMAASAASAFLSAYAADIITFFRAKAGL